MSSNGGRPIYQVISDQLRTEIQTGIRPPGAQLPSETELMATYGSGSRATVRRALAILETEGFAKLVPGIGMFVPQPPPIVTLRTSRFSRTARAAGKGALDVDADLLGLSWRPELLEVSDITAPPEVASVLGEEQARRYWRRIWMGDVPVQLAESYLPASIGLEWSWGTPAPGGLYGLLERQGYPVTRFREELTARPARPDEATALGIPTGSVVITVIRHAMTETGRVVEVYEAVTIANRHRYVYEFDVPED